MVKVQGDSDAMSDALKDNAEQSEKEASGVADEEREAQRIAEQRAAARNEAAQRADAETEAVKAFGFRCRSCDECRASCAPPPATHTG